MTSDTVGRAAMPRLLLAAAGAAVVAAGLLAGWWVWQRQATPAPHELGDPRMGGVVQALAQRLQANPQDAPGWAMLARSYATMGRHAEAATAYARAVALRPADAVLMADYADTLAMQQERRLAGAPMEWVERALALDPDQPKALLLAGTDAFDRRDYALAVQHWTRALRVAPPGSELARLAHEGLARAKPLAGAASAPR